MDHAAGLHAALDHPGVHRFLPAPDVTTLDALRARIARLAADPSPAPAGERWWNFAVRLRTDRAVIGRLEATTYGDWGEIAYVFGPPWWRQGLASEATAWLVRHLTDHGAPELWAAVHPANAASQRLLARLGFHREHGDGKAVDPDVQQDVPRPGTIGTTRPAVNCSAKSARAAAIC